MMTRRTMIGTGAAAAAAAAWTAAGRAGAGAEETHPPIGRFVTAAGLRLHALERGEARPGARPVVLIHGASGNLRDFSFDLVERLVARGLRVIAFDRPGLGYSERPAAGGDDPAVQARVLLAGARALGATPAVVVGHSYGGAVAMAWAVHAPETVAGAVILAGATYPWGGDAGLMYNLAARPVLSGIVRRAVGALVDVDAPEDVIARIFRPNPPPEGYARHVGVGLALRPEAFRANAADLHALNFHLERLAPRYADVPAPLEILHGTEDRTVWASVHAEPLARTAPVARLSLLDGVGHMPHHAEPDAVVAAVTRLAAAG